MCEYSDRVKILEDILIHPSSSTSRKVNRKLVRRALLAATVDLCDIRLDEMARGMKKLEDILDAKRK